MTQINTAYLYHKQTVYAQFSASSALTKQSLFVRSVCSRQSCVQGPPTPEQPP